MTDPTAAASGSPDSSHIRATVAHRLYESLMDLSSEVLEVEGQAAAGEPYSGLWDALQQSLDSTAALAAALRDLEKAESLRGLNV